MDVVAAAAVVRVLSAERTTAVLGAANAWDGIFAGAVEATRVYVRVGPDGFLFGAPGAWHDTVFAIESAAIDSNSTVL